MKLLFLCCADKYQPRKTGDGSLSYENKTENRPLSYKKGCEKTFTAPKEYILDIQINDLTVFAVICSACGVCLEASDAECVSMS